MYKDLRFPVLVVHRDIQADCVAGARLRGIVGELERNGFSVLATASPREGRILASSQYGLAASSWRPRAAVSRPACWRTASS